MLQISERRNSIFRVHGVLIEFWTAEFAAEISAKNKFSAKLRFWTENEIETEFLTDLYLKVLISL